MATATFVFVDPVEPQFA